MNTTLTVWTFATPAGADGALGIVREALRGERRIRVHDAAVVRWEPGATAPTTRAVGDLAGARAPGGASAGPTIDGGVNESFIRRVRDEVIPGTSAIVLMASGALMDGVLDRLPRADRPPLIQTRLRQGDRAALRRVAAASA